MAIVIIGRWVPVVREQRWGWFLLHQLAVAAIVMGHAREDRTSGVWINAVWFAVASVWFLAVSVLSRRRQP